MKAKLSLYVTQTIKLIYLHGPNLFRFAPAPRATPRGERVGEVHRGQQCSKWSPVLLGEA